MVLGELGQLGFFLVPRANKHNGRPNRGYEINKKKILI